MGRVLKKSTGVYGVKVGPGEQVYVKLESGGYIVIEARHEHGGSVKISSRSKDVNRPNLHLIPDQMFGSVIVAAAVPYPSLGENDSDYQGRADKVNRASRRAKVDSRNRAGGPVLAKIEVPVPQQIAKKPGKDCL